MHTIKRKLLVILIMGLLFGAAEAVAYVNPYFGTISLSEIVFQLSGSRGNFELDFNINELLGLTIRLIPTFGFELYMGTALYHYFCTASIYVFSRTPSRLRWYMNEIAAQAILSFVCELALMVGTILVTLMRFQVEFDGVGLALCAYHIVLYTLWIYALTVLVNLLAILFGSSTSFALLAGAQLILITLLSLLRLCKDNTVLTAKLLRLNPIAHLVLGWHSSHVEVLDQVMQSPYNGLYLYSSMLLTASLCALTVLLGASVVKRYDLLISNSEMGAL